ncbi:MAG: ABC transporter ATP-binding protein, partial [Pseudonocardia sp.]
LDQREVRVQLVLAALSAAVAGAGMVWAIYAASTGQISIGDIAVFFAAVPGVQGALAGITGEIAAAHQALLVFDHYVAIVRSEPDLRPAPTPHPVTALRSGIELRDVWFRYDEDHDWVLRGVDLTIPAGHSVALVGHNGAGKSTLVKLLCRFYDPDRGAVLWDGVDLRDLDVDALRERIGAVFQDFMDYDLTAAENIALGDLAALDDLDRITAAARDAGIAEKIEGLPLGYRTMLSRIFFDDADADDPDSGVVLSGGQWQRIALARGLLRARRDLLILDEPSAGLDAEAEHDVHLRIRSLRQDRTSLLISHRLSAVRDADVIAVLDDGRVREQGRHAELLAAGGAYARLFTLQARGYQMDGDDEPGARHSLAAR